MSARGLRLLKAMERIPSVAPTFDYSVVLNKVKLEVGPTNGSLKGSFTVDQSMCNTGGFLHGGYIASVVDVLSFYTQLSSNDGRVSWTISMNLIYTGPSVKGDKVIVESKTIKSGTSPVVEINFHNDKGKSLAKAITTFLAGQEIHQNFVKPIGFNVYEN